MICRIVENEMRRVEPRWEAVRSLVALALPMGLRNNVETRQCDTLRQCQQGQHHTLPRPPRAEGSAQSRRSHSRELRGVGGAGRRERPGKVDGSAVSVAASPHSSPRTADTDGSTNDARSDALESLLDRGEAHGLLDAMRRV